MILDLKRIFANGNSSLGICGEYDMSAVEIAGGFPLKKPVHYSGSVSNRASVVSLVLNIEFEYCAPCDRCGKSTSKSHCVTIERSLVTSLQRQESDTIIVVNDMQLEVDGLVYSEVVLNLPSKHLCKDDCKGLCCKCGKNLNEGECGCSSSEPDSRLAGLRDLLNS